MRGADRLICEYIFEPRTEQWIQVGCAGVGTRYRVGVLLLDDT